MPKRLTPRIAETGLLIFVTIILFAGISAWYTKTYQPYRVEPETKEAEEVEPATTKRDLVDPLAQVSLGLFIIKTKLSIEGEVACLDSLSESDDPALRQLAEDQAKHCDGYRMAIEDTQELAKQAIINGQPPATAYLFFTGDTEDDWMGLFTSLKRCQKIENIFRETDVPIRRCRDWKDTGWYRLSLSKVKEK